MANTASAKSVQETLTAQNEQLKTQLMATSLINEITKVMLASPELDSVFRTIILGIQETMGFERVILFEIDREGFCLKPKIWTGVEDDKISNLTATLGFMGGSTSDAVFLNKHIIVDVVDKDIDPLAALDPTSYLVIPINKLKPNFLEYQSAQQELATIGDSESVSAGEDTEDAPTEDERRMAVIESDQCRCYGVLWMDKPHADTLVTSDQMTTLTTLAYQAGIIIDNFEMYNELDNANKSLKEINERLAEVNDDLSRAQAKINKDLEHARVIQSGLLPTEFSDTGDVQVAARYIPASQVGGDYYDFFPIDDKTFGLVVADVSGHGVAAALVMAMTKVLLKTFSVQIDSARETLEKINSIFQNDIKTDNFVTIFYARIDAAKKAINFVSAGHNPIIYLDRKTKQYDLIKADGLFLGVFEDMMLKDNERPYTEGDRLVLYTDGLTEAESPTGEMYTLERLCEVAQKHSDQTPSKFIDLVMADLKDYTVSKSLEDDVTMLVIDF